MQQQSFGKLDQCLSNMKQSSRRLVLSQIFYQYGNVQIKKRYFAFTVNPLKEINVENIMEGKFEISKSLIGIYKILYRK